MIGLWIDVLGSDTPIGPDDDFFSVGGDSLAALRLFARVDREYGRDLPLAAVFSAPTPAAMVRRLGLNTNPVDVGDEESGRPTLLASSPVDGALVPLVRRLAPVVNVVETSNSRRAQRTPPIRPTTSHSSLCAHGEHALGALEFGIAAARQGRRPKLVLLIDAAVTSADLDRLAATGPGPERLVFLEPAEEPGKPITDPDTASLRRRLADRSSFVRVGSERPRSS